MHPPHPCLPCGVPTPLGTGRPGVIKWKGMPVLRSLVYHMLRAYINTQPNCTLLEGPTEAMCVKDQPAGNRTS